MKFINKEKIISAELVEPYENNGEPWDHTESHGWRLVLVVGHLPEGHRIIEVIDVKDKDAGIRLAYLSLELTKV